MLTKLSSNFSVNHTAMSRRQMLRYASWGTLGLLGGTALARAAGLAQPQEEHFEGEDVFNRVVAKAKAENWPSLPIGELIGKIAMEFKGTPYVGFTLELSPDTETCVVNLKGLDCVTFFEDSLCMARMLKHGKSTPEDLLAEVAYTRYRGGKMGNYTTRLHYTSDWFVDNEQKGVIKILAPELPGAKPFTQKVGIMSRHPENYKQLRAHPEMIPVIHAQEEKINGYHLKYIPMASIKAAEPLLQTGDIIGVCTIAQGIDMAHTGLCIKDHQGIVHFMDASSSRRNMRVTFETELSAALNWSSKLTGAMFARPLELKAS